MIATPAPFSTIRQIASKPVRRMRSLSWKAVVDLVHVPYRGAAPALVDLLSGQVQVYFAGMASSVEYLKTGKLRALATTAEARSSSLPGLATVSESVPGYEATDWFGLGAPSGTSDEIIGRLNAEVNAALMDTKFRARITDLGGETLSGAAVDFGRLVSNETDKWAKVVEFARIKPD